MMADLKEELREAEAVDYGKLADELEALGWYFVEKYGGVKGFEGPKGEARPFVGGRLAGFAAMPEEKLVNAGAVADQGLARQRHAPTWD